MKNCTIINITGFRGSGKDTIYMKLAEHFSYIFKMNFGNPLRNILKEIFSPAILNLMMTDKNTHLAGCPDSYRNCMLTVGNFIRETYGDSFFVDKLRKEIEFINHNATNLKIKYTLVFTDTRFPLEMEFLNELKDSGAKLYNFKINRFIPKEYISELDRIAESLNIFDVIEIDNYGTKEEFLENAFNIISPRIELNGQIRTR